MVCPISFGREVNVSARRLNYLGLAIFHGRLVGTTPINARVATFVRGQPHGDYQTYLAKRVDRFETRHFRIDATYSTGILVSAVVVEPHRKLTRHYQDHRLVELEYTTDDERTSYHCWYTTKRYPIDQSPDGPTRNTRIVERVTMANGAIFDLYYGSFGTELIEIVDRQTNRNCSKLVCGSGHYSIE